jgi:hypothetical protein
MISDTLPVIEWSDPYASHPAFKTARPSLVLDDATRAAMDRFDRLYATTERLGASLTASALNEALMAAESLIGEILGALRAQVHDDGERLFFDDLVRIATSIASEDLRGFAHRNVMVKRPRVLMPVLDQSHVLAHAEELTERKYFVDRLSSTALVEIQGIAKESLARFRKNAASDLTTRNDLSISSGPVVRQIVKVLNRDFLRSGTLDSMSAYMGFPVRVTGCALELSVSHSSWWKAPYEGVERPRTEYAHTDESLVHPKAIVYLTDVGEDNGPVTAYPGNLGNVRISSIQFLVGRSIGRVGREPESSCRDRYSHLYHQAFGCAQFRGDFMMLPAELRFNSHFGGDILPGSELERGLVHAEYKVIGSAGTFLAFDGGRLFHRGGLLKSGERVVLQVILGATDEYYRSMARLGAGLLKSKLPTTRRAAGSL